MSDYRFKITEAAEEFINRGSVHKYQFKVRFTGTSESGGTIFYDWKKCPIISVDVNEVMQTTDEFAASIMRTSRLPNRTIRKGSRPGVAYAFEDVTSSTGPSDVDIDLDEIFDSVR